MVNSDSVTLHPSLLHPPRVENRLLAGTVTTQRPLLADRIGTLKDPILPRRQSRKNLAFHGFRPAETQIRFKAREAVGREATALLEEDADLVIPIDVVEREG